MAELNRRRLLQGSAAAGGVLAALPRTVRAQNKGWRIDYINITDPLRKQMVSADIYHDVKHSDHCPVFLELKV